MTQGRTTTWIAHRGGRAPDAAPDTPTSSHRSDIEAITNVADALHLPVRVTADGALVIWHDGSVAVGRSHQAISNLKLSTVTAVLGDDLLTLSSLMATTDLPLFLEPKSADAVTALLAVMQENESLRMQGAVIARSRSLLKQIARWRQEGATPPINAGALVNVDDIRGAVQQSDDEDRSPLSDAFQLKIALDALPLEHLDALFINREILTGPDVVRVAHARAPFVAALTVNDGFEVIFFVSWGLDGIVTDRPQALREAFEAS